MLRKMRQEEVHRVYVVEEQEGFHKPLGVISLTDVLRKLVTTC
jgi:predicted transcriptional regulator